MGKVVVIDGPAGSGKSTTAVALAKKLGFIYLDTGAMYRALTLKFLNIGLKNYADDSRIASILNETKVELRSADDGFQIFLDGRDVTLQIRSNEVDARVSEVSAIPSVRDYMHKMQRQFACDHDIVAEGRDLGTFVFPDADVKIFLIADLPVRAHRRLLQKKAPPGDLDVFRDNLANRDRIDSKRKHSPLKKADDAIEIDTTDLTFDQQVERIYEICRRRL